MSRHARPSVQSRCEQAIEGLVCSAGRSLTALDVYRLLMDSDRAVSLSNVRRCLHKLATEGRIHRVRLQRTGRCIYRSPTHHGERLKDASIAAAFAGDQQAVLPTTRDRNSQELDS